MRWVFAVVLLNAMACRGAEQQTNVEHFMMRAVVADVVVLQEFKGSAYRTHFDPRFALTLRVESVAPPLTNFTNGTLVTFAIHSPTQLFFGDTPKGKTVDFSLSRKIEADKRIAWGLAVDQIYFQREGTNSPRPDHTGTNSTGGLSTPTP